MKCCDSKNIIIEKEMFCLYKLWSNFTDINR